MGTANKVVAQFAKENASCNISLMPIVFSDQINYFLKILKEK